MTTILEADTVTDEIIRLHIIANSNSETDQKVKLAVRDVLSEVAALTFTNTSSYKEACQKSLELLPKIEKAANDTLHTARMGYGAKATLGISHFPPRTYGNVTLPSGNYNALIITLGDDGGKNWWCVRYPPLCYTGESVASTEELSKIFETKIEYCFRITELLEEIKCFKLFSDGQEVQEQTS